MDLIFWRHAEAGDSLIDANADLERPLSARGERQAHRMAQWLNPFLPEATRILSSPAVRCVQTAQALHRRLKKIGTLAPAGSVEGLLAAARWPDSKAPVLIVGHQPTLGMAIAYLMAGEAARLGEPWSVKKGSIWWLRYRPRPERAEVTLVTVRTAERL